MRQPKVYRIPCIGTEVSRLQTTLKEHQIHVPGFPAELANWEGNVLVIQMRKGAATVLRELLRECPENFHTLARVLDRMHDDAVSQGL